MKIYIAARYDRRFEMLGAAADLVQAGHNVTSRWIEGRAGQSDSVVALEDFNDLMRADCLVTFTEDPDRNVAWAARGGRHVEFGIALAKGKRLCVVGPRENVFHHLLRVEVYANLADLIDELAVPTRGQS